MKSQLDKLNLYADTLKAYTILLKDATQLSEKGNIIGLKMLVSTVNKINKLQSKIVTITNQTVGGV